MCSTSFLSPLNRLVVSALVVSTWLACDSPPPPQAPAKPKAASELAPPAPEPTRVVRPSNLDEALNLLPDEELFHGFAMPMGIERHGNGRARKIQTTLPRLLRFYYSRYYQVVRTRNGELYDPSKRRGQSLKGSDYKVQAADPLKRKAILHISERPGSIFLLRIEERRARPLEQPALLRVLDAERQGVEPDAPLRQKKTSDTGDNVVPMAEGAALVYKRVKPKKLEKFSLRRTKKRALKPRTESAASRSVSNRIYNWSNQSPDRRFLD